MVFPLLVSFPPIGALHRRWSLGFPVFWWAIFMKPFVTSIMMATWPAFSTLGLSLSKDLKHNISPGLGDLFVVRYCFLNVEASENISLWEETSKESDWVTTLISRRYLMTFLLFYQSPNTMLLLLVLL
jgi:hypothetical protein